MKSSEWVEAWNDRRREKTKKRGEMEWGEGLRDFFVVQVIITHNGFNDPLGL